jgi:N-acetylglucosamine-6-phosphate deacetylase
MLVTPKYVWIDGDLAMGLGVEIEGDTVRAVVETSSKGDLSPHILMPGCQDLQVNGGGGVMVNSRPEADALREIARAHRRLGTTAILPTVITDRPEVIDAAADAAIAVKGEEGQLGLHIEGPHISPKRRGTHNPDFIRPLDETTLATVERLRNAGVKTMVTLAPELADPTLLRKLVATGAIVSAGHSAATAEETTAGLEAGITCFTHLYNAMPPMTSREPGILAMAILSDAFCGLIADGIHVNWDMIRLAMAARPRKDRMFLVSDAMATVGGPDHFELYGQTIRVRDGALVNAEGSLAGAHIDMVTSLANLHMKGGVSMAQAIAMATDIPRAVIGLPPQSISTGTPLSELIALDEDLTLTSLQ